MYDLCFSGNFGDVSFLPIREMLRTRFPRSPVYFMWSDPYSTVNRFRKEVDEFLCCEGRGTTKNTALKA